MNTELIDAVPIKVALEEIAGRETAQISTDAKVAYADARAILDRALAAAANPQFNDALSVEAYAKLRGVTPDAVRKQITRPNSRNKPSAIKRGGRWYIIKPDDAAA